MTTCNLKFLGFPQWCLKSLRASYDGHWRFSLFLGRLATSLHPFGRREVFRACSKYLSMTEWLQKGCKQSVTGLLLVADGRTMVLHGQPMVLVVFISHRPIVFVTGWPLVRDPVGDLSEMSRRPVDNQLQIDPNTAKFGLCRQPVCDWSPTGL